MFGIQETQKGTSARTGLLETDRGSIETPVFMPVGTAGTVKGLDQEDLKSRIDVQVLLGNTYHLYLRPGLDVLAQAGGLHHFMGWDRPILTDSGGFQVYSLGDIRSISEEGVQFRSHIDGSLHQFTPENVIDTQRIIGGDVVMAFDECPPYPCSYDYAKNSMELTHRWLDRCMDQMKATKPHYGHGQTLFPIIQGSIYKELRKASAEYVADYAETGIAIGGLSVGEPHETMYAMTELVDDIVPATVARYLMGVGTPANLLQSIHRGIDMFDCVLPTRNARHGLLYTPDGIMNMTNQKWKNDFSPVDEWDLNYSSIVYSKAYLRHLLHSKEILGARIATIHNLVFYQWLMGEARFHIKNGDFVEWKEAMVPQLSRRL